MEDTNTEKPVKGGRETPLTIISLFSGRYHTLRPYLHGLGHMASPNRKLIWATNSDDELFRETLAREAEKRADWFADIDLMHIPLPVSSNAFVENGTGTHEHAETIAAMYNRVFEEVDTPQALLIEDDVAAPPNTNRLLRYISQDDVGYACGVMFDRHSNHKRMFSWDLLEGTYPDGESMSREYVTKEIRHPWGVRDVGVSHLGLTALDVEVVRDLPDPVFEAKHASSRHILGCDLVLCLKLMHAGYRRVIDFDVRAHHFDSTGRPH